MTKRTNRMVIAAMVLVAVGMLASALQVNTFDADGNAGTGLNTSYGSNTTIAGNQTYLNFSLNASDDFCANITSLNITFPSGFNLSVSLNTTANMSLTGFNSNIDASNVTIIGNTVLRITNSTAGGCIWNNTTSDVFSINLTNTSNFTIPTATGTYPIDVNMTNATGTSNNTTVYLTVNPGAAHNMVNVSGWGQTGPVNTALPQPFVFQVNDSYDNPVPGVAVNFTNTSGSSINRENLTTTTDASGQVNVTLTTGSTPRVYSVTCLVASDNDIYNMTAATATNVTLTPTNYTAISHADNTTPGAILTMQFNTTNTTEGLYFVNTTSQYIIVNGIPGGNGTMLANGTIYLNSSAPTADYVSVTVVNSNNSLENATVTGIKFVNPLTINTPVDTTVYYNNGTIPTSVDTHVYYFFNGSSINITVETCARMNNVTANFSSVGNDSVIYNNTGVKIGETWVYNLTASGIEAGNETGNNVTVNLTFNGYETQVAQPFVALMNFNPIYMGMDLAGNTTNWKTEIADFTDVSLLKFEKFDGDGNSLGELKFWDAMNLTNLTTADALSRLNENMAINRSDMVLNSSALIEMNVSSNLTMYNLTFSTLPAIYSGGVVSVTPGNTSGGAVANLSYSGTTLTFNVSHWTDYTVAGLENVSTTSVANDSTSAGNFTMRLVANAGDIFTIDTNVTCLVDGNATPHDITVGADNSVIFNVTCATAGTVCVNATNDTTVLNNTNVVFVTPTPAWTFMVYLDGDNNLEAAAIDDFLEMSSVGSTSYVNIVVQFDRIDGGNISHGNWADTKRFRVTQGMNPTASSAVEELGEINMATPENLSDFMVWGMTNYPAERYALVLWNHGSGWKYPPPPKDPFKCIIYDDTSSSDDLSMVELRQALNMTENATDDTVDILGFDACLMAMVEVSYQVRGYCNVTVGSEENEPNDGWPYNTLLANLTSDPSMNATELGSVIVSRYNESYPSNGDKTQSAANQTELLDLVNATDNFAQVLNDDLANNRSKIESARILCEKYGDHEYVDLYHFAKLINSSSSNDTVQSAAMWVMENVSSTIIAEAHGSSHPESHGFSIYFPVESYSSAYNDTDFANDTYWEEFLLNFSTDYTGQLYVNQTGWWRECGAFNAHATPIQAAVDNATAGGSVFVYNGTYNENVNVTKKLTLQGEGVNVVNVVNVTNSTDHHVFNVSANYVNITGFTVTGATGDDRVGILLNSGVEHCNISSNNASGNYYGIYLHNSSNNTLSSNTANSNTYGICMNSSSNNTLTSNTASGNDIDGIYLECSSNDNTLTDNTASSNDDYGIYLKVASNDNTIDGNTASGNAEGIVLEDSCNDNTLTNNTLADNSDWDIYINSSTSTFTSNMLNGANVSFTYSGNVSLKGVTSPPVNPTSPSRHNITKYINATNQSAGAWLFLNFSYSNDDVYGLNESDLAVWKHNGTWYEESTQYLDTTNDVVGANITSFSIFAPMALVNASSMINVSGWGQEANVTETLDPFIFQVNDVWSNPVPNVKVNFTTTGGTINRANGTTNASGQVNVTLTFGTTAGAYNVTCIVANNQSISKTITTTATAGDPASMINVSGTGQTGSVNATLTDPIVFQVNDTYDNPVSGVAVNFTNTSGSAIDTPNGTQTDASGQVQVNLTLGSSARTYSVTCIYNPTINNTVTADAVNLTINKFGSDGNPGAGLNTTRGDNTAMVDVQTFLNFSLNASDPYGGCADLTSLNLTFTGFTLPAGLNDFANLTLSGFNDNISASNVTLIGTNVLKITNSTAGGCIWNTTNGVFSINLTNSSNFTMPTTVGSKNIYVNVTSAGGDTVTDRVILVMYPGNTFNITVAADPTSIVANDSQTSTITATVTDVEGNNVADGTNVTFQTNRTANDTLSAATATTTSGVASITLKGNKTGVSNITASNNSVDGYVEVTMTAGPVTSIVVTPTSASLNISEYQEFNATAKDKYGNNNTSVSFTWSTMPSGVGTLSTVDSDTVNFTAVHTGRTEIYAVNGIISSNATYKVWVTVNATTDTKPVAGGNATATSGDSTAIVNLTNITVTGTINFTEMGDPVNSSAANGSTYGLDTVELIKGVDVNISTNITQALANDTSGNSYVYVRIDYNQSQIDDMGIDEDTLFIYKWVSSSWVKLVAGNPPYCIANDRNTTTNYVSVNVTTCSILGLGGSPPVTPPPPPPPSSSSGGGGGTYPPATPTPTVTPTATPTATATAATTAATTVKTAAPAKTAAPGMTAAAAGDADEKTKPKKKGLLPGFEGIFAIAGLLAVAYLVMRKRRT